MTDNPHRGAKIGPRIATLVSQSIVATHKALIGTKHKLAMLVFRAISDEISAEVDLTLGPLLQDMKARYDNGGPMAGFLDFLASGHGQWKAIVGTTAAASGLLSSLAQVMNNELYPAVYAAVASNPHFEPDQQTAAQLAAAQIIGMSTALDAIAKNGYDEGWGNAMIESERQYPSAADSLDMLRRGFITQADFVNNCARNGIPDAMITAYLGLLVNPISPADAALAVLRTNITLAQAQEISAKWGITPDDLNILIGNTGEPLGLMQLLEAFRRGFIDQPTLEQGIRESRVRDEWIPTAVNLRYSPMSVSDAVNAVVQNQLDMASAADKAQQSGLEPSDFPVLVNTAGEPPSRDQMFDLYNRGLTDQATVIQAERESRLKNKYNDLIFALHEKLLEPRMLSEAVEYGSVTVAQAVANAQAYGYSADTAQILVGLGTARKLQTYKNKVIASIETMYEDGVLDNPTATNVLTGLGITSDEAAFILEASDMKRSVKQTEQVISAIRTKYLGHHILDADATNLLTTAGVPSAQISYLLAEWQIEVQAATRVLTEAQIVKAVKDNLIPGTPGESAAWLAAIPTTSRPTVAPLDGQSRLMNLGYSQEDADLLLQGA